MIDSIEIQIYKLINKSINNTYSPLVDSILRDKSYLDRVDIIQDIYIYFVEKDYVNKFDSSKGKLSSFVYRFVRWYLFALRRQKRNPEMLFTDLRMENDNGETVEYEIPDFNTPEDQLLEKKKEKNIKQLKLYVLGRK